MSLLLHQLRYDQKAFWRNPAAVFFTVMFPVVLLLIFATVFSGKTIEVDGGIEITAYYVPAIITLAVISATMQSLAMSLVIAREDGRLKRGRGTPMPAWVFIAGRVGNSIVTALLMLVLIAVLGRILYGVAIPWGEAPAILVTLVVGAAAFSCLGIALTAAIPSQDAAAPIVNALLLPLYFLSGIFIPDDELPDGVINFANHFPIRDFFQAFFNAYLPGGGSGARLGQPRRRRDLGHRRPAALDPLLPLDPPRRLSRSAGSRDDFPAAAQRAIASSLPAMLHHVLLEVSDLDRAAAFYDSLLAPLGWRRHFEEDKTIGWGIAKPVFFIAAHHDPQPGFGLLSFSGLGIVAVKAAWENGMKAGGVNVSDPGEQRSHGSGSYSAFLKDPDGYEIEITIGSD